MNSLTLCAAGVIASVLAVFLKKHNAEYSFIISVCAASVLIVYISGSLISAVSEIENIFAYSKLDSSYLKIMLKCVGICFLTEFSCDCCKDAGQGALSAVVLMGGRIFVLVSSLPMFSQLLRLVVELAGEHI